MPSTVLPPWPSILERTEMRLNGGTYHVSGFLHNYLHANTVEPPYYAHPRGMSATANGPLYGEGTVEETKVALMGTNVLSVH